ncbi:MAG: endolytic transglycosylase MltG [Prevotellaceae bacterium]|nr:endolytic transglycosylase MltG [Prevotellaceae bacterium]
MTKRTRNSLLAAAGILLLAAGVTAAWGYYQLLGRRLVMPADTYIYIDRDDTPDSVVVKLQHAGAGSTTTFRWLAQRRHYADHLRTGRYRVRNGDNIYRLFNRLYRGEQSPVNLTIGSVRSLDRLAGSIGRRLMIDSVDIAPLLNDTMMSLFIPNTYEVYWNISAPELIRRMQREHDRFWTADRRAKAQALEMTPAEVSTLASIVAEETNDNAEKPTVAGLYINRLRRGMPLQADPTVKFALQDFTLRRVLNEHLQVDSPYNTYLYRGLPPGPIRIPTPVDIDAVLDYRRHNYLYMCAKEDFSGSHNFATNLADHLRNARRYQQALNARRIY